MKINLVAIEAPLADAWEKVFKDVENVSVTRGSIFDFPADALVSPANSFGYMNGGIDFAISKNLGWHIEKRVQEKIRSEYFGELLVGQALVVPTDHRGFPYLISAPTMRTPMTILRSPNVYLAMKAILTLIIHGRFDDGRLITESIQSVAIPGLGTGVGQVPPMVCARQMRLAWEDVVNRKYETLEGWEELRSSYAYFFTHDTRDIKVNIP